MKRIRKPKHWRKQSFVTREVYCGQCGRGTGWPCRNDAKTPPAKFHQDKLEAAIDRG